MNAGPLDWINVTDHDGVEHRGTQERHAARVSTQVEWPIQTHLCNNTAFCRISALANPILMQSSSAEADSFDCSLSYHSQFCPFVYSDLQTEVPSLKNSPAGRLPTQDLFILDVQALIVESSSVGILKFRHFSRSRACNLHRF